MYCEGDNKDSLFLSYRHLPFGNFVFSNEGLDLVDLKNFKDFFYVFTILDLFHKLFRQDLLVASLFRNFLLAERVMRSYNCTPISHPRLPPTYMHPMW